MTEIEKFALVQLMFFAIHCIVALILHKNFLSIREDVVNRYGEKIPTHWHRSELLDSYQNIKNGRNFFIFLATSTLLVSLGLTINK